MGKKPPVSLRKPPAAVDISLAERFVRGENPPDAPGVVPPATLAPAPQSAPPAVPDRAPAPAEVAAPPRAPSPPRPAPPALVVRPATPRAVLARKDGRELRRMTIYLPTGLARRLAVYCAERDVDMSDVVAEAVHHLVTRPADD